MRNPRRAGAEKAGKVSGVVVDAQRSRGRVGSRRGQTAALLQALPALPPGLKPAALGQIFRQLAPLTCAHPGPPKRGPALSHISRDESCSLAGKTPSLLFTLHDLERQF